MTWSKIFFWFEEVKKIDSVKCVKKLIVVVKKQPVRRIEKREREKKEKVF